jgi:hypothetical protein
MQPNRAQRHPRSNVSEWLDTIGRRDAAAAAQVQRAIDASYLAGIPVGEARELALSDLMPSEAAALFGCAFADTQPMAAGA